MKKETLLYIALVLLIFGITLIGWGLGRILNYPYEGFIIGSGLGLSASALGLLKVFRWRDAFEKK